MLIFVNNIPLHVVEKPDTIGYSRIVDLKNEIVKFDEISGTALIKEATHKNILSFIDFLQLNGSEKLEKVTFLVTSTEAFKKFVKKELQFVKASGGVVENHDEKLLMIKRLGFWDLPKGKAEGGENAEETALREVEEECSVSIFVKDKVVTTWHTYFNKGKLVIKRTKWYAMGLISDSKMKPQKEEGIEEIKWMNQEEVEEALKISYHSIKHVILKWRSYKGVSKNRS